MTSLQGRLGFAVDSCVFCGRQFHGDLVTQFQNIDFAKKPAFEKNDIGKLMASKKI